MADASSRTVPTADRPWSRDVLSLQGRIFHGIVAAVLAAAFAVGILQIGFWDAGAPDEDPAGSVCMLRRTTGLPCPTCGLTRSFYAMGRGAVGEAFEEHPLGPLVFLLLAVVLVRSAGIALAGRAWLNGTARVLTWSLPFVAGAALLVWVVRLGWMVWSGAAGEAWRLSLLGRLMEGMK